MKLFIPGPTSVHQAFNAIQLDQVAGPELCASILKLDEVEWACTVEFSE